VITDYQQSRQGDTTTVTVSSDLSGTIYYHWYLDGAYLTTTQSPTKSITLEPGDYVRVEVIETTNPDYDPIANAPAGWPARRTVWWTASTSGDTERYRVEQQKDGGAWSTIGTVLHERNTWSYSLLTARLDDLSDYAWRVIPVDQAGNDGTTITLTAATIVRTPDAPEFTATYDDVTERVTFAEAA
jgi:hypothetical protein